MQIGSGPTPNSDCDHVGRAGLSDTNSCCQGITTLHRAAGSASLPGNEILTPKEYRPKSGSVSRFKNNQASSHRRSGAVSEIVDLAGGSSEDWAFRYCWLKMVRSGARADGLNVINPGTGIAAYSDENFVSAADVFKGITVCTADNVQSHLFP
jgi:hypothetical protein